MDVLLRQRHGTAGRGRTLDEVLTEHPDLVEGWTEADFDELYSRVGTGGGLTPQGALDAIRSMNRKREVLAKVEVLLESGQVELVEGIVGLLYRKVVRDGR
ncbi:MAG: hypothetical protein ABIP48_20980 [Planctomycetota bacterium]